MEIRKFQDEIAELLHPIRHPRIGAVLCLVEEIGELVKACMNEEVYREGTKFDLINELGDVLTSLAEIANCYNLQLDEISAFAIEKVSKNREDWISKYSESLKTLRQKWD